MIAGHESLRILVAEDDELISELLAEMLAMMGHQVCGIESSEIGTVCTALQVRPDLMIIDVQLSPGCGISAVDTILMTAAIPHVLVTGNVARAQERRPTGHFLQKPYSQATLTSAIQRASGIGQLHG